MTEYDAWCKENYRRTSWTLMESGLDHVLTQGLDPAHYGWQWIQGYWVRKDWNWDYA
jgi:hypothetical protein